MTFFQAANNPAGMFLPVTFAVTGGILANLMTVLYVTTAIVATIIAGRERLSRMHEKQVQSQTGEQKRCFNQWTTAVTFPAASVPGYACEI